MFNKIYKTKNGTEITLEIYEYKILIKLKSNEFYANYDFLKEYDKNLLDIDIVYFDLLVWLLFYNLEEIEISKKIKINQTGNAVVSYSGGVDSTALISLFGGIPIHICRSYNEEYESRQIKACEFVDAKNIVTNFEQIRILYIGKQGFNVGSGYGALYFPVLEILNCDTIYFGVVFDDLGFYYSKPFKFNDNITNSSFHKINNFLNDFGIKIRFPLAGYSEVLTTKITEDSGIKNFSSCHTFGEKNHCNVCYKCFRKQGIRGRKIDLTDKKIYNKITNTLKTEPLKMASSTIWAIQNVGYKGTFFSRYYDIDVSWCERINKYYNDEFGIPHDSKFNFQTDEDIRLIKEFVSFINNKKLYL